ncbi:MAG TPA: hypothetical protein PLM14_09195 [Candidatus Hydrogenedentes bacterium]|nr:hypothetical protein [Candidatus Hydrogenedentota bacterium]
MSLRLVCLASIVLSWAFAFAEEPANLAANPGFETAADGGFPAQWSGNTDVYSRDTAVTRSGEASLKFQNADPNRYVLCSQALQLEAGLRYEFSAWVKTENIEGNDSGATLCIEYWDKDGKYLGGEYPSGVKGTSDWTLVHGITQRIPEAAAGPCPLACYVRQGMTGTAWWDDLTVSRFIEDPLSAVLKAPNYRNEITRRGPRDVVLFVELNLRDYALKLEDVSLRCAVYPENGAEPAFTEQLDAIDAASFEIALRSRKFEKGNNRLEIALLEKSSGKTFATETINVRRAGERVTRKVDIDNHNRLIVEGKPFFPLGMYWSGIDQEQLDLYADSAFNCLMPYGMPSKEEMDMAEAKGLKVLYSVKDIYHGTGYCPDIIKSRDDEEPFIRERVEAFKEHPALLAWYINDELPLSMLDRLSERRGLMERLDPDHPTWVVLYQVDDVRQYLPTFHAIGTDPYPIPKRPVALAGEFTRKTVDAVCGARPVWMVPQVFNWANYHDTPEEKAEHRAPTREEMRSMAWQCIAEGANGLVFYSWFDLRRDPATPFEEQWAKVKQVAAGIAAMTPALLSTEEPPVIEVDEEDWLNWTVKQYEGSVYLIAVNNEPEKHVATFRLPKKTKKAIELATGEKWPMPDRRQLELQFEPLEVHIVALYGMGRAWSVGVSLNLTVGL